MFESVLIANRGEIAVRVARTLADLGVFSIGVYSDADAQARHVGAVDLALRLGPASAAESYLNIEAVVAAAVRSGAQAVHPGYGFLAENADFARACAAAGLVFIGPSPEAIELMGDKIRAKQAVASAGVPVVAGRTEPGMSDDELIDAVHELGFPVLLKPSAGGGGKGMRLVVSAAGLRAAVEGARREAAAAFGDDTLLVERYIERPRHLEVQVLADRHGTVLALGERECSLQRRHQKIIEEAPSPLLDEAGRTEFLADSVAVARACGYVGAGTVEFITDVEGRGRSFLEMNTRLQVEHPVTEAVTGVDLVEWQLRVAAGERLDPDLAAGGPDGHAVEARIYAEDPDRGFLPTGGRVLDLVEPAGAGVRVDSGLRIGAEVGGDYDPMLAKVIAWGPDRRTALRRLDAALGRTSVLGVTTNVAFLRALLGRPEVREGVLDTGLVERVAPELVAHRPPDEVLAAAALERQLAAEPAGEIVDPWDVPDGWRAGGHVARRWWVGPVGGEEVEVTVRGLAAAALVRVSGGTSAAAASDHTDAHHTEENTDLPAAARLDGTELVVEYDGRVRRYRRARGGEVCWLGSGGRAWALVERTPLASAAAGSSAAGDPIVRSPMPGTVLSVAVVEGDEVRAGQPLLIVEAMKMEHTVVAPVEGRVHDLRVRPGSQVAVDEALAVVTPVEAGRAPLEKE
ncbi:acetyl-CoA/propionyl-CoA carboxylase biotin carboxyl carrier protein [Actinoalloteichus hoggarensis]|uniref:biotin carboxylase n=1 Tax=Actinoalloteichus hoggarensis TaxID=1470176 RepID=A0A221W9L8_9PSEU|nr:biotin carboxylase N-terminal domain-containing protein [Actinoalloteichus hoggarensis]ASO22414.1 Acetyl-/propionyl-coenzyme A carboxylase alpha chain [Actinoalloteichus hoggarensis]MBB5923162.1 acetyl-CoA/propionyl-CoA carboxylase biotin carboxyl carrier protein [Actinoalloteichus hoggarensis]